MPVVLSYNIEQLYDPIEQEISHADPGRKKKDAGYLLKKPF